MEGLCKGILLGLEMGVVEGPLGAIIRGAFGGLLEWLN